jgi:dTDP-4-amino-4,6-dideoxygalactose transaminase
MGIIKLPQQSIEFFKYNLDEIFLSGNLAEGPWNKKLSQYIQELTGAKKAITTNSNGAGIVALLQLFNSLYGRDSVLLQSNTMYGVKTMIPAGNCKVAGFIDCKISTLMPGLEDVKNAIYEINDDQKKKLIVLLSHIGGIINPDIKDIAELCTEENITLIEDCAHSFGATLYDQHSGLFGDAGVYSFYSTKAIPAGEGGVIVTKNEVLGDLAFNYSIYDRFKQEMKIGFNNRISEIQALFAYSVVSEWESIIQNKGEIAKKYISACEELKISYISQNSNGHKGNYYKFVVYNPQKPILEQLYKLVTKTSPVYNYSIGVENPLATFHACLPIWYDQDPRVTDTVITELFMSIDGKLH